MKSHGRNGRKLNNQRRDEVLRIWRNFYKFKLRWDPSVESAPWPNERSEYELKEIIGVGSIAHVYGAYCIPRSENCAIKVIDISKFKIATENLSRQFQVMTTYIHQNLVSYYTSFVVEDTIWLVTSLLEGGSLRDIINYKVMMSNRKYGVFDETTIATVLKNVLTGLEYLHKNGQSHRDIKAGNILFGDNGMIQITDFGITAWLASGRDTSRLDKCDDFVGSPYWMAPETMNTEEEADSKLDIWSVGITAIEMATGNPPYYKYHPMKVIKLTLQNDPPNLDTGAERKDQYRIYGKTFRKFIAVCLNKDPVKRPTAAELLQHPFLQKAKGRKLLTQTVVPVGPSYVTRVQKASRRKPEETTGLHRTESREWMWNEPEVGDSGAEVANNQLEETTNRKDSTTSQGRLRLTGLKKAWSNFIKKINKFQSSLRPSVGEQSQPVQRTVEEQSDKLRGCAQLEPETPTKVSSIQKVEQPKAIIEVVKSSSQTEGPQIIKILLRYRGWQGKLKDIHFLYSPEKETPESLVGELVKAGLLDPQDVVPVANYLTKLIQLEASNSAAGPITFHLNSTGPNEEYDEQNLVGFAQLTLDH